MKNKCIVFFIGTMKEGGAERVVSLLANEFVKRGYPTKILTYYNKEIFFNIDSRIKIDFVTSKEKSKYFGAVRSLFFIRRYFKENADVVYSFLAPFNIIAIIAHFGLTSKIIASDRVDPERLPSSKIIRMVRDYLYRYVDTLVVQTQQNKDYFDRRLKKKCKIIYNPINLGENKGLALRTEKQNLIVSVGRLDLQKNQKMLINAFNIVHKEFPFYKLIIYGEGYLRKKLEDQIKELNLDEDVLLPGSVKDVHNKIAKARLFVLSSDYEGMSNALLEAMCLGLPVVSTAVSGSTDIIQNDINGILIETGDEKGLVDAMRDLIDNDKLQGRLGREALKINEALNTDKITDEWLQLVERT